MKYNQNALSVPEMVFVQCGSFIRKNKISMLFGATFRIVNHKITLPSFYISKYQITQAQWKYFMGNNPSYFKGDNLPVEQVSIVDAINFSAKLSEKTEKNYRLPTETEWEFAAKGGVQSKSFKYSGSDDLEKVGWYWNNSGDYMLLVERNWDEMKINNCRTRPVGSKAPNELGIYDMSGNVSEWCKDYWHENYDYAPTDGSARIKNSSPLADFTEHHVLRGGSWIDEPDCLLTTSREHRHWGEKTEYIGFRVVCS